MGEKSEFGYTTSRGWTFCEFVDFRLFTYLVQKTHPNSTTLLPRFGIPNTHRPNYLPATSGPCWRHVRAMLEP